MGFADRIKGKFDALRSLAFQAKHFSNWREVWTEYRLGQVLPELKLRGGPTLYHGSADDILLLYRENFVDQCYTAGFYQPQAGDHVFDCGANIGIFALNMGSKYPEINIHCFEPASQNLSTLKKNIDQNNQQERIKVYPYGIFDKEAEVELLTSGNSAHRSLFKSRFVSAEKTEKVKMVPFAQAFEMIGCDQVDFMKIDVEGAEVEILEGTPPEVLKRVKKMAVEYHDLFREGCHDRVSSYLQKCGFAVNTIEDAFTPGLGIIQARVQD